MLHALKTELLYRCFDVFWSCTTTSHWECCRNYCSLALRELERKAVDVNIRHSTEYTAISNILGVCDYLLEDISYNKDSSEGRVYYV
jgi:hypothetical protein